MHMSANVFHIMTFGEFPGCLVRIKGLGAMPRAPVLSYSSVVIQPPTSPSPSRPRASQRFQRPLATAAGSRIELFQPRQPKNMDSDDAQMIIGESNKERLQGWVAMQREIQRAQFLTYQLLLAMEEENKNNSKDEDDEEEEEGAADINNKKRKIPKKRSVWTKDWVKKRSEFGQWEHLIQELLDSDRSSFKNFFRMDLEMFNMILERIRPRIKKQHTFFRKPLEPELRLAITLRFLATGDTFKSLGYSFRVPHNSISKLVHETCEAIIAEYQDEVIVMPSTPEEWKDVAKGFKDRWQLPHCVGSIDGKHIALRAPKKSGSYYYNYKGFHSILLLAVVDSEYKFRYIDVGANGSCSDAGVFLETNLRAALDEETIGLPPREPLPGDEIPVPYFLVGDEAFALKEWLMKPYPSRGLTKEQRIFNYRISRARIIIENVFGILAARFRVLLTSMLFEPERAEGVVLACCVLHNILRIYRPSPPRGVDYEDPVTHETIPGAWRGEVPHLLTDPLPDAHTRASTMAKNIRNYLKAYLNSTIGSVPWQDGRIERF